jgi:hypothetical protein
VAAGLDLDAASTLQALAMSIDETTVAADPPPAVLVRGVA